MGLTAKQAEIVKDGWELGVLPDVDKHAMNFFCEIFERAPPVKAMFSFLGPDATEEEMRKSTRLQKHATGALKAAGEAAASLADSEEVPKTVLKLKTLGRVHAKYKVVEEQFPVVKAALMSTLKRGFRSLWNDDMEAAWSEAADIAISTMIEGLREGYAKIELKKLSVSE